ncbi:MAG: hypothetical protein HQ519_01575, partial [Planctomycetes bacterium]|nr:hypothetical protein [Planctomycetota bacterium]
ALPLGVPLAIDDTGLGEGVGSNQRDADHGTIAMNSNRDILVVFHTTRKDDFNSTKTHFGELKQVEFAYFEYKINGGVESWEHLESQVIGSIDHSPILGSVDLVRCERPDVVAVDDKFFVVWTRLYGGGTPGTNGHQPATIECAWVEKSGTSNDVIVHGDPSGFKGLGKIIDQHVPGTNESLFLELKECAGVVDAVRLFSPSDPNTPYTVGVVYPHQTYFSTSSDDTRKFNLRVATCGLDTTRTPPVVSVNSAFLDLKQNISFNGDLAPSGQASPGLILPDLAPSSEENAFWAAYEQQTQKTVIPISGIPTEVAEGKIKLQYIKLQSSGEWEAEATKTFKTPSSSDQYAWRRRPMISSYTADTSEHVASIAFGTNNSHPDAGDKSGGVVLERWEYDEGSLAKPPTFDIPYPIFLDWPNDSAEWDDRPVPLMGRSNPFIRRCYAARVSFTGFPVSSARDLISWDPYAPGDWKILDQDTSLFQGIRRPAAAYHFEAGVANPDYFAITWEKTVPSWNGIKRVYLMVE